MRLIKFFILFIALNSCSKNFIENQIANSKKTLKLVDSTFESSDGTIIAYSDNKLLNKPTIFFIHGYMSAREGFLALAKKLNDGNFRLILVDVPGFGESSKDPQASYKITDQAKRMNELINALNLSDVHLVGTSMGGAISIATNGTNELIKSNTLIAPLGMPLYTQELPGILEYFVETGKLAFIVDKEYNQSKTNHLLHYVTNMPSFVIPNFVKKYIKNRFEKGRVTTNKVGEDILYDIKSIDNLVKTNKRFSTIKDSFNIEKVSYSNQSLVNFLNKVNKKHKVENIDPIGKNYEDLTSYLQKIKNPVLVYWGTKDNIIHYKTMETMKPHLQNAKYTLFKNGSHIISINKAKTISKDIKNQIIKNLN